MITIYLQPDALTRAGLALKHDVFQGWWVLLEMPLAWAAIYQAPALSSTCL